jgi:hypothetical protein
MKSNDLRLLLITSDLPDFIPDDLPLLYENIIVEYEKLSNDNSYSAYKEELNENGREMNHINRLKAIYQLMLLGDNNMIDELSEIGINIDKITPESILRVKSFIELQQTNLEIYMLRHAPDDAEKKEEFNFLTTLTRLSNFFQRQIPNDIVVTEFVTLMSECKKINKSRRDGRTNKL